MAKRFVIEFLNRKGEHMPYARRRFLTEDAQEQASNAGVNLFTLGLKRAMQFKKKKEAKKYVKFAQEYYLPFCDLRVTKVKVQEK